MTRIFSLLLGAMIAVFFLTERCDAWEGVVVRVIDGDSLKVQRDGRVYELRLYGIDTPEYRQAYSNKAKQFAKRLAYRQVVSVREMDVDRYGRIVAVVSGGGKVINRELVRAGLAWYYPRYCHAQPFCSELRDLERRAQIERRGLWRDENPVAPWEWKRKQREDSRERKPPWDRRLRDLL